MAQHRRGDIRRMRGLIEMHHALHPHADSALEAHHDGSSADFDRHMSKIERIGGGIGSQMSRLRDIRCVCETLDHFSLRRAPGVGERPRARAGQDLCEAIEGRAQRPAILSLLESSNRVRDGDLGIGVERIDDAIRRLH